MNRRKLLSALAALPFMGWLGSKANSSGLRIKSLPHAGPVGDGVALNSISHPVPPLVDTFTMTFERVFRADGITLTLRDCYEGIEPGKYRASRTVLAKMLLELAEEEGELHVFPDAVEEIRSIVATSRVV